MLHQPKSRHPKPDCAQAISALLRLAPSTATLQARDAHGAVLSEEDIPVALVQKGDLLKVPAWQQAHSCLALLMYGRH